MSSLNPEAYVIRCAMAAAMTLAMVCLWAPAGLAHFFLMEPPSYSEQNFLGDPQKVPPCGQGGQGQSSALTGVVTTLEAGSTLTIDIDERIYHPGHYRVAIAQDEASLPEDPPVTAGASPCGFTVIDANPELPVLADGLLVHDAPFDSPQSMAIQLPAGLTCDRCLLQVIQFMSDHAINVPGGCFYHHCATVSIVEPGGTGGDAEPDADVAEGESDAVADTAADVATGPDAEPDAEVGSDAPAAEADVAAPQPDASGDSGGCGAAGWPLDAVWMAFGIVVLARRRRVRRSR